MPANLIIRELDMAALMRLADQQRLFVILDATDAPSVYQKVAEVGLDAARCLYRGLPQQKYAQFAPYLVQANASLVDWIRGNVWDDAWGIFVAAAAQMETLEKHFRHFLLAQLPDDRLYTFRFYDPRIMQRFVTTCTPAELRRFYGPVMAFGASDPGNERALFAGEATQSAAPVPVAENGLFLIGPHHVESFQKARDEAFIRKLSATVRSENAGQLPGWSDNDVVRLVSTALSRCRGYGINDEASVHAFTLLMLDVGPDFDQEPAFKSRLENPNVPAGTKMTLIANEVPDREWARARNRQQRRAAVGV